MPGKIKVKILAGRNLPVMDRSGDTTDAYVEIKFDNTTYKTDVCRKSLNPQWNSEWYRFEVDDAELQDEPLQIRLMDHDTYSANDAIGKVYLNLNPLLLPGVPPPVKNIWTLEATMSSSIGSQGGSVMTGWIPVYDTMHGIRGEVNIIVKVELFSDFNRFRQSSCGVQFFYSPNVPHGYHVQIVHGFVEELLVSDDPEYKWIDKIRTPRASNEARQTLFFKLSGEVQRKIGLKALDLGGNAVIGYLQNFDLGGESGIVARGIGTAVTLVKLHEASSLPTEGSTAEELALFNLPCKAQYECLDTDDSVPLLSYSPSQSPISSPINLHATRVSNKFPGYGRSNSKRSRTIMKVTRYRSAGSSKEKVKQASVQPSNVNLNVKKSSGSNQSSDDLTDDTSFRTMLALEDMRGECTGNRFSRGLKNLKYLPQNMLSKKMTQIKAKVSDSHDEESDLESTFSSNWSIGGSDSTKSSIVDVHLAGKKKKLIHKSNMGEGMAALLIKSVHSGFPLDSVREDRETPTPSPVKFLADVEFGECRMKECKTTNQDNDSIKSDNREDNPNGSYSRIHTNDSKSDLKYDESYLVPMISSSETDTSTSDDDPSESSTNYNILDDSSSLIDPGSPIVEKFTSNFQKNLITVTPRIPTDLASLKQEYFKENTDEASLDRKLSFETSIGASTDLTSSSIGSDILFQKANSLEETGLLSQIDKREQGSSTLDQKNITKINDMPGTSNVASDILIERQNILQNFGSIGVSDFVAISSSMTSKQTEYLNKQEQLDNLEDSTPVAASTPTEHSAKYNIFFPECIPSSEQYLHRSISLNEQDIRKSVAPVVKLKPKSESFKNEKENRFQVFKQRDTLPNLLSNIVETNSSNISFDKMKNGNKVKCLVEPVDTVTCKSEAVGKAHQLGRKEKFPKKIERTDTVIYKGPSKRGDEEKPIMPMANKDLTGKIITAVHSASESAPAPKPIIVASTAETDGYHLQVPIDKSLNTSVKSCYPQREIDMSKFGRSMMISQEPSLAELKNYEKLSQKYRRHCMLELIKLIDVKMIVQPVHYEKKGSVKSKRKRRDKMNMSLTPSPDSVHKSRLHRKKSKSKSPEKFQPNPSLSDSTLTLSSPFPVNVLTNKHAFVLSNKGSQTNDPTVTVDFAHKLSTENLFESNDTSANLPRSNESHFLRSNENITSVISSESYEQRDTRKTAVEALATICFQNESLSSDNINLELNDLESRNTNSATLLLPVKPGSLVYKSHGECSLGEMQEHVELTKTTNAANVTDTLRVPSLPPSPRQQDDVPSSSPANPLPVITTTSATKVSRSPAIKMNNAGPMHRRSSDSDLSITPKGNSLTGSDKSTGAYSRSFVPIPRPMNQDGLDMFPFITMQQCPPGFIVHLGGLVSAKSVKLLERISNLEEPQSRDAWWTEIRMEIRSHARALGCNVVLGYKEETSMCDDVCVLSVSGTAAVINLQSTNQDHDGALANRMQGLTTIADSDRDKAQQKATNVKGEKGAGSSSSAQKFRRTGKTKRVSENNEQETPCHPTQSGCILCHLPYSKASIPFRVNMSKCAVCNRAKVPDVMFATIQLPESIPIVGRGCFIQSVVCKPKRDLRGELNAKEISDCMPFLEYELHSLLMNKLKVKGMNAIFGLKMQVSIGERLVVGMAVGTAVFLSALPPPPIPQIAPGNSWHEAQLIDLQKTLAETVRKNREFYRLKPSGDTESGRVGTTSETDESDDDLPDLDLGVGGKDVCVLEVDDVEDIDRISLLMGNRPPDGFHVVNTQTIPGLEDLEIVRNLQLFTQISRTRIPAGQFTSMPAKYFEKLLQTVYFKLRRMVPCALCDLQFRVALPEQDEIQFSVVGMALGLGEPTKFGQTFKRKVVSYSTSKDQVKKTDDSDMIFNLEEDHSENVGESDGASSASNPVVSTSAVLGASSNTQKSRSRSPSKAKSHILHKHKHVPLKERYGVDITPLSYLPGGKIERYLGNLNFFFIRESTSIRENGGPSGFTHSFITEILAIVRAHITALGGNAMVAFSMTQCVLLHSPHKNQGQCLINVGGDVVFVSYFGDEKQHSKGSNC